MATTMMDGPTTNSTRNASVQVVIVNYRTADLTCDCLRSLKPELESLPHVRVTVTDNASGDDSLQVIGNLLNTEDWNGRVQLLPLEKNGGFAYGNNSAIEPALNSGSPPDFVLLLNPDTIVRPGAISSLLRFMFENPNVGLAGSRLEDPDGTPQRSAFRFPTISSEFERSVRWSVVSKLLRKAIVAPPVVHENSITDWVAGASMLIRRQVFEDVGPIDEGYFMYFEEVDFCLRAQNAGWSCWYVPDSRVVHLVGQASGVTDTKRTPQRRPAYWFESRRRFFLQNKGALYSMGCDLAFMMGMAIWKIRRIMERKQTTDPPHLMRDFFRHSVFLRGFSA